MFLWLRREGEEEHAPVLSKTVKRVSPEIEVHLLLGDKRVKGLGRTREAVPVAGQ